MYLIRDVFQAKPGMAKDLVAVFKEAAPHLDKLGAGKLRVMTDTVAGYWTVVMEFETESLETYFGAVANRTKDPELNRIMSGYMDLVTGGHREIFEVH